MKNILNNVLKIVYVVYFIALVGSYYLGIKNLDFNMLKMAVVSTVTPFACPLIFRILKLKKIEEIYLISILFIFVVTIHSLNI